ncbi:mini-ribonuclease [Gemella sp. GH3]|uniref:Mini-ribonuclease 3 n=1 Tax=unclassified Gemella TaxID=2624949 RepID=UPI0015D01454|nr:MULTISPECIES: ribonuclease III domain-containing protein [unclassified Gemella]MBF0713626.1 mini-ribonuclease [Gemella sp. GH3.1]NYS50578.1 mini-ribonuclease [Gemella sp. GH3]
MEENLIINLRKPNIPKVGELQALSLAYIGDSIYDIMAREYIMKNHLGKINDLHKRVSSIVSAKAQSKFMQTFLEQEILTDEELKIYSRAKNQKNNTKAKNATVMEYKLATGLEAVFGYLYLNRNFDRLEEVFSYIIEEYEKTIQK